MEEVEEEEEEKEEEEKDQGEERWRKRRKGGAANESDNSVCRAQAAWNAASNRVPAFINLFPPAFLLPASFYRLTICFTHELWKSSLPLVKCDVQ